MSAFASPLPLFRLCLLLPVLGTCLLAACSFSIESDAAAAQADADTATEAAIAVETIVATPRTIAAHYTGTATLEARAEAQVVARTSGVALAVLVEEGQAVRAGQALVRLDPDQARLRVAQSQAQMRKLNNNYQRALQLLEQQLVSPADVDQLRFDLDDARARHQAAELELSYTTVKAPMAGVIASRDVKPGNFVQIHSPILRIVDISRLEATLNVPERELARLQAGQPVELSADALPGQVFSGQVDRVAPVVDAGTGTFRVIAAFAAQGALQPGMFGRLRIRYDTRADVLAIPRAALLDDEGEAAVYVVHEGVARRTGLTLGAEEDGWVEVRAGLQAGDAVVTAGKSTVRDGSAVRVTGDDAALARQSGSGGHASVLGQR